MAIKIIHTAAKVREFSKRCIVAMTFLWFAGAVYGGFIVWRQGYGLDALLSYVGTPMSAGIIGYMAKAALENREKAKRTQAAESEIEKGEDHP